jgi:hypothetical protein
MGCVVPLLLLTAVSLTAPPDPTVPKGFKQVLLKDAAYWLNDKKNTPCWMVSDKNGKLVVETSSEWEKRIRAQDKAKGTNQRSVKIDQGSAQFFFNPGSCLKVEDGWLQAADAGEFGGGLFWWSKDGSKYKIITDRNAQIVSNIGGRIYAVESLAHMDTIYGSLVEVRRTLKGWETAWITDIHVDPRIVVLDGDRFVFATDEYVSTLEPNGKQKEIFRQGTIRLRAFSAARLGDGTIWLGEERYLLRLTPKKDGNYGASAFVKDW